MNERIRELVGQAKFMAEETINKQIPKNAELDAFAEKFAELIVEECLDIVANADMTELEGPDPEDVLYVACKQIREHFGVEE